MANRQMDKIDRIAIIIISLALVAGLAIIVYFATVSHPAVIPARVAPSPIPVTHNEKGKLVSEVGLTAYIIPAIDFTVDPSGNLQTVTITNTGAWDLSVTCTVTDEAEGFYVNGLKLDGEMWSLFDATIERDGCQEFDVALAPDGGAGGSGTLILWVAEAR